MSPSGRARVTDGDFDALEARKPLVGFGKQREVAAERGARARDVRRPSVVRGISKRVAKELVGPVSIHRGVRADIVLAERQHRAFVGIDAVREDLIAPCLDGGRILGE
jgi:hypothetical protein